jgi:hypothetical protein
MSEDQAQTPPPDNEESVAAPERSRREGDSNRERWIESISVALLAIASITAAWCGYQANLWGGEQAAHYTEAGARRAESIRATGIADRATQIDVALLIQWIDASQTGDQELADFYESRFTPALEPAFDAWIETDPFNNPDAPSAPFAMPEYVQPEREQAHALELEASELFDQGQSDNGIGDNYVLATVFLAATLFFLAVSTGLKWFWAQIGLTGVAGVMLVVALGYISTLGVAT